MATETKSRVTKSYATKSYVSGASERPLLGVTIGEQLDLTAARFPDNEALVVPHQGVRWRYGDFKERVDRLAAGLLALGLEPGDRIGIWSPNNSEWALTQFAAAKAGLILVNINPAYRLAELEYALNKVECRALVTAESFKSSHYIDMLRRLAPELDRAAPGALKAAKLPRLEIVVRLGAERGGGMVAFAEVAERAGAAERRRLETLGRTLQFDDPINIQLTRAGHAVTVFERDDRCGGLMRYGIPEFKMEKRFLDRRLEQMEREGTEFRTNAEVGVDPSAGRLRAEHDAVVLAGGALAGRDLPVPGRELDGIHLAMEYLTWANRVQAGDIDETPISARGKRVVIIGGGDTGADCLGTAHRQGAASVHQFEILPRPPDRRASSTPWPTWPLMYQVSSAHEEGGEREFAINTEGFAGDGQGRVAALRTHRVEQSFQGGRMHFERIEGTDREYPADLVLLALGFTGPEPSPMLEQLGVEMTARGNVARDGGWSTSVEGVFAAGDMGRGQSLIVWAIAEGRSCAAAVDRYLMGDTLMPDPVSPADLSWR